MQNSPKKVIISLLLCVGLFMIALVGYWLYAVNTQSLQPTSDSSLRESANLQIFTDKEIGISFQYPEAFDVKTYIDPQGGYVIQLVPKSPINIAQPLRQAVDSIYLGFSDETIETAVVKYQEDMYISNLAIEDISIENKTGKKISFTSGIGIDTVKILLSWKDRTLLEISYFPNVPEDKNDTYRQVIESVRQIK